MKIAIVAGIVVAHDAISAAVIGQAKVAATIPGVETVTVFAQHIDRGLPCPSFVLSDPWKLVAHPAFAEADVVIFHWGIHYALFDVVTLSTANPLQRNVIHFHNCTPRELVEEGARQTIDRSLAQVQHAIGLRMRFWTFSDFNVETLVDWGVDRSSIAFVPFPIDLPAFEPMVRTWPRVELLTIGRRVPSKGLHTLLEAVGRLDARTRRLVRLRVVGSASFSSSAYLSSLSDLVTQYELADIVEFIDEPTDEGLWDLLRTSDVVVSASLHEGLCVPIIEGYAFGCRAIGTMAGNLPFIIQPCDLLVPTEDPGALAFALGQVTREVKDKLIKQRVHEDLVDLYSPLTSGKFLEYELRRLVALTDNEQSRILVRHRSVTDSTQTPTCSSPRAAASV